MKEQKKMGMILCVLVVSFLLNGCTGKENVELIYGQIMAVGADEITLALMVIDEDGNQPPGNPPEDLAGDGQKPTDQEMGSQDNTGAQPENRIVSGDASELQSPAGLPKEEYRGKPQEGRVRGKLTGEEKTIKLDGQTEVLIAGSQSSWEDLLVGPFVTIECVGNTAKTVTMQSPARTFAGENESDTENVVVEEQAIPDEDERIE